MYPGCTAGSTVCSEREQEADGGKWLAERGHEADPWCAEALRLESSAGMMNRTEGGRRERWEGSGVAGLKLSVVDEYGDGGDV